MKLSNKINGGLYAAIILIIGNLIVQNDWGIVLFVAGVFVIGGIIWRPLITFMSSDNTKNKRT